VAPSLEVKPTHIACHSQLLRRSLPPSLNRDVMFTHNTFLCGSGSPYGTHDSMITSKNESNAAIRLFSHIVEKEGEVLGKSDLKWASPQISSMTCIFPVPTSFMQLGNQVSTSEERFQSQQYSMISSYPTSTSHSFRSSLCDELAVPLQYLSCL
jgi:hypothetical protein